MSSPEGPVAAFENPPSQTLKDQRGGCGFGTVRGGAMGGEEETIGRGYKDNHGHSPDLGGSNSEVALDNGVSIHTTTPIGKDGRATEDETITMAGSEERLESCLQGMNLSTESKVGTDMVSRKEDAQHLEASSQFSSPLQVGYQDPTPKTPGPSVLLVLPQSNAPVSPAHASSNGKRNDHLAVSSNPLGVDQVVSDAAVSGVNGEEKSESEIQSIMDQFEQGGGPGAEEVMSPRLEIASPLPGSSIQHPPRKSSLEPVRPTSFATGQIAHESPPNKSSYLDDLSELQENPGPGIATKPPSLPGFSQSRSARFGSTESTSPRGSISIHKPPLPEPDPEPDLPFDFHRFLEQLRHRTADPVAKFLRSFLVEFSKKQWMVHEQVKIISDFLAFITNKMAQCEIWREVSDAEFDNAKEGMEKLVMNRLYSQTFSPAIPPPPPVSGAKGKKKNIEKLLGPGRRGQHQEDIERDEVLAQKVRIYGWVREEHLDIPPVGESGRRFLILAQQELLKIKTYRAPRDKVICVLNCCKVIFGLLRNSKSADTSADSFVPLLIYVVLQANPDHLVSNIQYILRFRNQDKLGGEAGYYLSSLMGAIQFIENLDRTVLTVSDGDFEKNVEAAVSAIAEPHKEEIPQPVGYGQFSEKSRPSKPEVTPRHSMEAEQYTTRKFTDNPNGEGTEEKAAIAGLMRTIQRPLSSIGRIFSEESASSPYPGNSRPQQVSAYPPETPRRLSPAVFQPPRDNSETRPSDEGPRESLDTRHNAEDAAARQASAEAAEAHRMQRAEHHDVVETLAGMFPDLDRDVIDDVVRMKEGRVGLAVDACLALSS